MSAVTFPDVRDDRGVQRCVPIRGLQARSTFYSGDLCFSPAIDLAREKLREAKADTAVNRARREPRLVIDGDTELELARGAEERMRRGARVTTAAWLSDMRRARRDADTVDDLCGPMGRSLP